MYFTVNKYAIQCNVTGVCYVEHVACGVVMWIHRTFIVRIVSRTMVDARLNV